MLETFERPPHNFVLASNICPASVQLLLNECWSTSNGPSVSLHMFRTFALKDFFLNVKDVLRKPEGTSPSSHNYHELEKDLQEK